MENSAGPFYYRLMIAQDKLSCWLELCDNPVGACVTASDVYKALDAQEVKFGVDQQAIESLFSEFVGVPSMEIARGRAPIHGQDGRVEVMIDVNPKPQFVPDETSVRVDFKSSVRYALVQSGELICKLIPPTYGTSGKDVTGREIVARRGMPEFIKAGEGIYEENALFYAAKGGRPSVENKMVKVLDVLEVKGSVSLGTGNINYPGPVVIEGDVPDGFEVRSESEITVMGTVGDALLISGKKITVAGGVLGKDKAKLVSSGSIEVKFANHAELIAKGDILVTKDLLHCHAKTLAKILLKGRIIGGVASARDGIEAAEGGSENGVVTLLRVNFNYETENLQESLEELFQRTNKISASVQSFLHTKSIPIDKLSQAKDLLQLLKLSESKAFKLNQQIKLQLKADQEQESAARIKILSKLHPGVRTESPACYLDVQETYRGCQVLPGADTGKMKVI